MQKVLLLDIENVPKTEDELLKLLTIYQFVYVVYAKSPVSMGLDGLQSLSIAIMEKRLILIKMPKAGPDSADFGLAFLAGQLSIQLKTTHTHFDVMSNDKKIEYIVDLLRLSGFKAEQLKKEIVASQSNKKAIPLANTTSSVPSDILIKSLSFLVKNQPKKLTALVNGLKSWMKLNSSQIQTVIADLQKHKLLKIENNTFLYDLKSMQKMLKNKNSTVPSLADPNHKLVMIPTISEIQKKPHLQRVKQYCDFLFRYAKARPAQLKTLINSLKSILKLDHQQAAQDLVQVLKKQNIITLSNTKIQYLDDNIRIWAELEEVCLSTVKIDSTLISEPNSIIVS